MVNPNDFKERSISGRYITLKHLKDWFTALEKNSVQILGTSEEGRDILGIELGHGSERILMWSQMHGNESTTTKGVVDLVNFLISKDKTAQKIKEQCTLFIIPILNPDGAVRYTRENANGIDLNRDAVNQTQAESIVLLSIFKSFKPDYCFNLHDQRTLFGVGSSRKPATVSFLSPASDEKRSLTDNRTVSMKLIVAMNSVLQNSIPGQVGRYDDAFNPNCVGDTFQMKGVPTLLFEAGHYPGDYEREQSRELIFMALVKSIQTIALKQLNEFEVEDYFTIPENTKSFYDFLILHPDVINSNLNPEDNIAIQFKEALIHKKVHFVPEVAAVGNLQGFYGHTVINCKESKDLEELQENKELFNLVLSEKKK